MRLPLPPARMSPVTEATTPAPLRHHRRRDALPEAVLPREEKVVLSARGTPDHGDAELVRDLVAHPGKARARDEEGDLHLRGLDHHFRGQSARGVEDLVRAFDTVEPHLARD